MTTVIKSIGSAPGRDYATPKAFFDASSAIDFDGTTTEWIGELYADDEDGFLIPEGEEIVLDNQLTSLAWGRRLRPATGHEWRPYSGAGAKMKKILDGAELDDSWLAVKREKGFRIDGPIGLFLDTAQNAQGSGVYYGIRIAGEDCKIDGLFIEWLPSAFTNWDAVLAIRIEKDSGHAGSPAAKRISIANCTVWADPLNVGQGFHRGINVEAPETDIADIHLQSNSIYGCVAQAGLSRGISWGLIGTGYLRILNNVSLECSGGDFVGSSETVLNGNVSSDETGYIGGTFDPDTDPKAFARQTWLNAKARDFRLRFDSPALEKALGSASMAIYPETVETDADGVTRSGVNWDAGAYEGGFVPITTQPTIVENDVGVGFLHESVEAFERGTRGNLAFVNEIRRGKLHRQDNGDEQSFDSDLTDDPEDLTAATGGWAIVNGGEMVTGDAQVSAKATPWGFGNLWELDSTAGATNFVGVSGAAGTYPVTGQYSTAVVAVVKGDADSFRINIRNVSAARSDFADFDWTGGVPVLDTAAANVTTFVRGPYTVGGDQVFFVQLNHQSQSGDSGDTRELILYNVKAAGPFGDQATHYGFVRVVTRSSDIEHGYASGTKPTFGAYWTMADSTRYRELVTAADKDRWQSATDIGVQIHDDGAGSVVEILEPYYRFGGILAENNHAVDVDRAGWDLRAIGIQLDGCAGKVTAGAVTTNAATCFRLRAQARDALVANPLVLGTGSATGAKRGVLCEAGATGRVANASCGSITAGASAIGIEVDASSDVLVTNSIAVSCDTDFSVPEVQQSYNISSDTTALGVGAQVSQGASALFEDPGNLDFRLKKTSPALNAGTNLGFLFSRDYAGKARTAPWECGAYDGFAFAPLLARPKLLPTNRIATLWDLVLQSGQAFRFTDNNEPIDYEGQSYTPIRGASRSAMRREAGGRESSLEIVGVVSSEDIKSTDLRAGKYRNARIRAREVDWLFPWTEPWTDRGWNWLDGAFTDEIYQANIVSDAERLHHRVGGPGGGIVTRTCPYKVGDKKTCKVNIEADTQTSVAVTTVDDTRRTFKASSIGGGFADDFFAWGELVWQTGANVGVPASVVKSYTASDRTIELQLRLPFDVQVGDLFRMEPGDDKLFSTCRDKFSNEVNYGGHPFVPGTDIALSTPTQ